jgi:plastocyanin
MEEIAMRKIPLLAAMLAVAAAAPAIAFAGDPMTAAAKPTIVEIRNMHFTPDRLTIAAGTTVTWVNEDDQPHTVTDRGRAFRSAALDTKDSFSYTFAAPGEFTYFCTIHPMMVGRIVVKPAGSSS